MNRQTSAQLWRQLREELVPWIVAPYAVVAFGLVPGNLGARRIMPPSPIVVRVTLIATAVVRQPAAPFPDDPLIRREVQDVIDDYIAHFG